MSVNTANNIAISTDALVEQLKQNIIEYMLKFHNIQCIEDETEKQLYDALLSIVEPILIKYLS